MDVTHLEVRRHPTWQAELHHALLVPEYRVLNAERQRRRVFAAGVLLAAVAILTFLS